MLKSFMLLLAKLYDYFHNVNLVILILFFSLFGLLVWQASYFVSIPVSITLLLTVYAGRKYGHVETRRKKHKNYNGIRVEDILNSYKFYKNADVSSIARHIEHIVENMQYEDTGILEVMDTMLSKNGLTDDEASELISYLIQSMNHYEEDTYV